MGELIKAFNSAMDDLQTIDWTETDGTDVKNILKTAFAHLKQYRFEIISNSILNQALINSRRC